MIKRLEAVVISHELSLVANEHRDDFTHAIQEQLHEQGVKGDGEQLKPYKNYMFEYEGRIVNYPDLKHEMNPAVGYGNPDLFFTGGYYSGMYTDVAADGTIEQGSNDYKADQLEAKYGKDINKLTQGNATVLYNNVLHPDLVDNVSKLTGIK